MTSLPARTGSQRPPPPPSPAPTAPWSRARWRGGKRLSAPDAAFEHHSSQPAGAASPLKAYYVERNRLFVLLKNFPLGMLAAAPWIAALRYFWHAWHLVRGRGAAARFRAEGHATARLAL